MKHVADTSWLIAHFNADDRFHSQARKEFQESEGVHIPAALWVEFLNVFQYRYGGHTAASRARSELRRVRKVQVGDRLDDDAAASVWKRHPGLTFADAAAVAEARRLGVGLLTFDSGQREAFEDRE